MRSTGQVRETGVHGGAGGAELRGEEGEGGEGTDRRALLVRGTARTRAGREALGCGSGLLGRSGSGPCARGEGKGEGLAGLGNMLREGKSWARHGKTAQQRFSPFLFLFFIFKLKLKSNEFKSNLNSNPMHSTK